MPARIALSACLLAATFVAEPAPATAENPAKDPAKSSTDKARRIAEVVAHYERHGYLNGAILVADRGQVIYTRGIGLANMEAQTPNTPKTRFGIASITKQFTAALVLQQAAEGRLALDGKVSDYLPWYRADDGARMTVNQLLLHTSGLPPDFDWPEFGDDPAAARRVQPQTFAQQSCQPGLRAAPGSAWAYSNCGYILLGLILERVSGQPFAELLQQRLLNPLGMHDTGLDRNDLVQRGGAAGYLRRAGPRYTPGPDIDRTHIFAAGAMYSTVEDLHRWSQALAHSDAIAPQLRQRIFQPALNDWAYGWFVRSIPAGQPGAGQTLEDMRGDLTSNYFAWILRYPQTEASIIVLRNGYGSTEGLEENLQAILFDREPTLPGRKLADIAVSIGLVPARWIALHPLAGGIITLLAALLAIGGLARRRRRPAH